MTFAPRLDVLSPPQRALWNELSAVPRNFVLYGGTALALRLGHRASVDFDFFSHDALDHAALETLPFLRDAVTLQEQPNTRTLVVDRGGPIKLSFFGSIAFGRVGAPELTEDNVLGAASLLDLGGTKIKALLQRVESKDYQDIIALLDRGIGLAEIFGAAGTLFGGAFNSLIAQKALCYFEGGDLETLDATARERLLTAAVREVEPAYIPRISPRLDS